MEPSRLSGNVVFPDGVRPAEIVFDGPEIKAVEECDGTTADASQLIFPGFIDVHVHAREFPQPQEALPNAIANWESAIRKETFLSAGLAAINGGVTLYCAMPNDAVPPDDVRSYSDKLEIAAQSPCPTILFAAVTQYSEPWADLPYKVYLDAHPSTVSFTSWSEIEVALSRYRGCRVFFHAEDPQILSAQSGPRWKTRPPQAEIHAVERILDLTSKFDLRTHMCHISTKQAVVAIQAFNRNNMNPVTCEVTPHHMYFSVDRNGFVICHGNQIAQDPSLFECNPPLRSEDDRRFLLEALKQGIINIIATDHAPHTLEDKSSGAAGIPHLDTVGAFAGWLVQDCGFSPVRIAEALSAAPARLMSTDLNQPHGVIEPGAVASFSVLDLSLETLVEGGSIRGRGPLQTRCGWSPFSGISLPAAVKRTVVLGKQYVFS